jgi:hypothetical protein
MKIVLTLVNVLEMQIVQPGITEESVLANQDLLVIPTVLLALTVRMHNLLIYFSSVTLVDVLSYNLFFSS